MTTLIEPAKFSNAVDLLRSFFLSKGFQEVHTQNRLSILAACEDPTTVATYNYSGEIWPLPQTGQMWLEHELLTRPEVPGFFCVSTSYRQEPNPVPGRHEVIFPMFEFEFPGNIDALESMLLDLCAHMGFGDVMAKDYKEWAKIYGVEELDNDHEKAMSDKFGTCMIKNFPNYTSPFWNMKQRGDGTASKIDVIIEGQETIGAAERATDPEEMRHMFNTISEGMYADLLFSKFGKERVEKELDAFFKHKFVERVGGGIGMTRIMRALDIIKSRELESV
ncbi:MAG: transposase [Alphaproteobacteria bacterium]|nr:transposase [Alphaproteobacteria bacterium]